MEKLEGVTKLALAAPFQFPPGPAGAVFATRPHSAIFPFTTSSSPFLFLFSLDLLGQLPTWPLITVLPFTLFQEQCFKTGLHSWAS